MDKPPPDDFDPYGGDMNINGADIPKSTVAVAVVLWGVLAGLGAWTLTMVSDMRAEMRASAERNNGQDSRIDGLERRVNRHDDDLRELQRTRR